LAYAFAAAAPALIFAPDGTPVIPANGLNAAAFAWLIAATIDAAVDRATAVLVARSSPSAHREVPMSLDTRAGCSLPVRPAPVITATRGSAMSQRRMRVLAVARWTSLGAALLEAASFGVISSGAGPPAVGEPRGPSVTQPPCAL